MSNFTRAEIDADIAMLTNNFSSGMRIIPSNSDLFKKCLFIPLISFLLSCVSTLTFYLVSSMKYKYAYSDGYINFLTSEGWVLLVPTAIVGLLFAFMTYNNLIMYMAVPEDIRRKSVILIHLRKLVKRTVALFLILMIFSALLSGLIPWLAFAIPALLFVLLFAISLVVGSEINRLGAGLALEKISKLLKKI
jgi:ABC-type multidrug transport system permease subunit